MRDRLRSFTSAARVSRWLTALVITAGLIFAGGTLPTVADATVVSWQQHLTQARQAKAQNRWSEATGHYELALREADQPERFLRGLQDAGYATDPRYADKVLGIFERSDFDVEEP